MIIPLVQERTGDHNGTLINADYFFKYQRESAAISAYLRSGWSLVSASWMNGMVVLIDYSQDGEQTKARA